MLQLRLTGDGSLRILVKVYFVLARLASPLLNPLLINVIKVDICHIMTSFLLVVTVWHLHVVLHNKMTYLDVTYP